MFKYFYIPVLLIMLNSCFSLTPYSLNGLEEGMTETEVRKKMGYPYTTKAVSDVKLLTYYIHDDIIDFIFTPTKFPFIGFYPIIRTGQEYWIILEDKKVIAFGNKKDFDNRIIKLWSATPKKLYGKKFSDEDNQIKLENIDLEKFL